MPYHSKGVLDQIREERERDSRLLKERKREKEEEKKKD